MQTISVKLQAIKNAYDVESELFTGFAVLLKLFYT